VTDAGCPANDALCERDWIGFEAIAQLHAQIDDDHNGSLDRLESDEVNYVSQALTLSANSHVVIKVMCIIQSLK